MFRPTSPTPSEEDDPDGSGCQRRPASSSALRIRSASSAVAGTSGRRGGPAGRPEHLQRGLHRDRVGCDEQRVEQRRELLVDLAGGRDVAGLDQLDHLADLRPDQVRGHATRPPPPRGRRSRTSPSRRPSRPRSSGASAIRREIPWKSPVESFTATMLGFAAELQQCVVLDARRRAARDVVRDDRQVGGVGDALEVRHQSALRRLVVVRRDDEEPVRAGVLGRLGQLEGLGGLVGAGAADQLARGRGRPRRRRGTARPSPCG